MTQPGLPFPEDDPVFRQRGVSPVVVAGQTVGYVRNLAPNTLDDGIHEAHLREGGAWRYLDSRVSRAEAEKRVRAAYAQGGN